MTKAVPIRKECYTKYLTQRHSQFNINLGKLTNTRQGVIKQAKRIK